MATRKQKKKTETPLLERVVGIPGKLTEKQLHTYESSAELKTLPETKPTPGSIETTVSTAVQKFLGVSIAELTTDISSRLARSPLVEFTLDSALPFKEAKKKFKQEYLKRLLRITYGNVSEVAKKAGVDRRSIHRIVKEAGIDVNEIREEMIKPYSIREQAVSNVIEDVLSHYKTIIHPEKLSEVYSHVKEVSKDILEDLPETVPDLKAAEEEFEKEYLQAVLDDNKGNITKTAKQIGIRYETLLRKLKQLGLR